VYTIWTRYTRSAVLILNVIDRYAQEANNVPLARPLGGLRFWLEAKEAPSPVVTFNPLIEMAVRRNGSGFYLFYGHERLSDGSTRRILLPGTQYKLRVTSPSGLYQDKVKSVPLPLPDLNQIKPINHLTQYTIAMEPGPAYNFDGVSPIRVQDSTLPCTMRNFPGRAGPSVLRGSLYRTDGTPVVEAEIKTLNLDGSIAAKSTSSASGEWLLWFIDRPTGQIDVLVTYPKTKPSDTPQTVTVSAVCIVRGFETVLGQTAISGVVVKGERPFSGAVVSMSGLPNLSGQAVSAKNGVWTYYFPIELIVNQPYPQVTPTVTLPDGSKQRLDPIELLPRRTVSVRQITRFS
jgi:hypothetical protein